MLNVIKAHLNPEDREEGFTLIELMVVVLIIAILLAIAIPTFLGARNTANARAAQSNVRNALTAEQTYWTNSQAFGAGSVMSSIEPNLVWVSAATALSATGNKVLASVSGSDVEITALGADGKCYTVVADNSSDAAAGTQYNVNSPASGGACSVPAVPTGAASAGSASNNAGTTWYTSF